MAKNKPKILTNTVTTPVSDSVIEVVKEYLIILSRIIQPIICCE